MLVERELDRSIKGRFAGLFIALFLAREMSADTLVMMILLPKRFFKRSNKAFCIMSVTW